MATDEEYSSGSDDIDSETQAAAEKRLKELQENGYRSVELFRQNKSAFEMQLMDHWKPALDFFPTRVRYYILEENRGKYR